MHHPRDTTQPTATPPASPHEHLVSIWGPVPTAQQPAGGLTVGLDRPDTTRDSQTTTQTRPGPFPEKPGESDPPKQHQERVAASRNHRNRVRGHNPPPDTDTRPQQTATHRVRLDAHAGRAQNTHNHVPTTALRKPARPPQRPKRHHTQPIPKTRRPRVYLH